MNLDHITFETLLVDAEKLNIDKHSSYILSYPYFLSYFDHCSSIKKHHLVTASHFAYGWMPTVLKLDFSDIEKTLFLLNAAYRGHFLNMEELSHLKKCINNSIVGVSKLLHFINPNVYAIWDSRVSKYITGKSYSYGVNNISNYMDYMDKLGNIQDHPDFLKLHSTVESKFDYPITGMRAIEIIMFSTRQVV